MSWIFPTYPPQYLPPTPIWQTGPSSVQMGWQCPGCGACYAPFVPGCAHCTGNVKPENTATAPPSQLHPGEVLVDKDSQKPVIPQPGPVR